VDATLRLYTLRDWEGNDKRSDRLGCVLALALIVEWRCAGSKLAAC